jgi:hypothetical protein
MPTHAARIVLALVAFYVAKSIVSGGNVALDQFEVWLLACFPLAIFVFFERLWAVREGSSRATRTELLDSWTVSITLFVLLRSSFLADLLERPLYQSLNYEFQISNALISAAYIMVGTMLVYAAKRLFARSRAQSLALAHVAVGLVIQWIAFYVCIFVLPPTAF